MDVVAAAVVAAIGADVMPFVCIMPDDVDEFNTSIFEFQKFSFHTIFLNHNYYPFFNEFLSQIYKKNFVNQC